MIEFLFNHKELELLFLNAWIIISIVLIFALVIILLIGLVVYGLDFLKMN